MRTLVFWAILVSFLAVALFRLAQTLRRTTELVAGITEQAVPLLGEASDALRDIHDRMPVIVSPNHYARWLDAASPDVGDVIAPWSGDALRVYPVSTRVNAVRNDDARICDPIDITTTPLFAEFAEPELAVGADEAPDEEMPVQASLF